MKVMCRLGLHRWHYAAAHSDYPALGIRTNYWRRTCGWCGLSIDTLSAPTRRVRDLTPNPPAKPPRRTA